MGKNKRKRIGIIEKYNVAFAFFIIAILVILILNLFSLDFFPEKKHEVRKIYFADNISVAHSEIIDLFNEKYIDEIEVVPIDLSFDKFLTNERKELFARTLRSENTRIDIFSVDLIWISRFAKWAEPLDGYFSSDEIARIIPKILNNAKYEKKLYSIPLYLDFGILCYKRDFIRNLPNSAEIEKKLRENISWKELIDIGTRYGNGDPFYLFEGESNEGMICNFLEIVASMGGSYELFNEEIIDNEQALKACIFMRDLIHKYKLTPAFVTAGREQDIYPYFLETNTPFLRSWFSNWFSNQKDIYLNSEDSLRAIEFVNLPGFEGNRQMTVLGGWNLMINRNCLYKDDAAKFLKFVLSDESQRIFFDKAGYLPVITEIYDNLELFRKHVDFPFLEVITDHSVIRPGSLNYTKVSDIISFHINKVLKGDMEPEKALKRAADIIASEKIFIR